MKEDLQHTNPSFIKMLNRIQTMASCVLCRYCWSSIIRSTLLALIPTTFSGGVTSATPIQNSSLNPRRASLSLLTCCAWLVLRVTCEKDRSINNKRKGLAQSATSGHYLPHTPGFETIMKAFKILLVNSLPWQRRTSAPVNECSITPWGKMSDRVWIRGTCTTVSLNHSSLIFIINLFQNH